MCVCVSKSCNVDWGWGVVFLSTVGIPSRLCRTQALWSEWYSARRGSLKLKVNQRRWRLPKKASLSAKEASSGLASVVMVSTIQGLALRHADQKFIRNDDIHNTVKISSSKYISERETQLNTLGTSSYSYTDGEPCNMPGSCLNFFCKGLSP